MSHLVDYIILFVVFASVVLADASTFGRARRDAAMRSADASLTSMPPRQRRTLSSIVCGRAAVVIVAVAAGLSLRAAGATTPSVSAPPPPGIRAPVFERGLSPTSDVEFPYAEEISKRKNAETLKPTVGGEGAAGAI